MINKKELRLGNWFQDKFTGDKFRVILISDDIIGFDYETEKKWQAEPIPLTEEILLRCGFERLSNRLFRKGLFVYDIIDGGINYFHPAYQVKVEHLHRLQNIFYETEGKELEYEED